jgi:hypothetical protein
MMITGSSRRCLPLPSRTGDTAGTPGRRRGGHVARQATRPDGVPASSHRDLIARAGSAAGQSTAAELAAIADRSV